MNDGEPDTFECHLLNGDYTGFITIECRDGDIAVIDNQCDDGETLGQCAADGAITLGEGGTNKVNLALRTAGSIPFGSRSLEGYCTTSAAGEGETFGSGIHCFNNINDGVEGNANSWIAGGSSDSEFVGVALSHVQRIGSFSMARDNLGTYSDRTEGRYFFEYTRSSRPLQGWHTLADDQWCTIQAGNDGAFTRSHARQIFWTLSEPVYAAAVRVRVTNPQSCIDELMVFPP